MVYLPSVPNIGRSPLTKGTTRPKLSAATRDRHRDRAGSEIARFQGRRAPMEAPYATETSGSSSYTHYLSGWCPGCGRRRGPDARCANCDPWWTSPLFQLGVPAVLATLFLFSTTSAVLRTSAPAAHREGRGRQAAAPAAWSMPAYGAVTPVVISVPRTALPVVPVASTVVSTTTAQIAAQRQRDAVLARMQSDAAYADSALTAANAAQAEQAYMLRNRAVTAALAQQNTDTVGGMTPSSSGTGIMPRTAVPEGSLAASVAQ